VVGSDGAGLDSRYATAFTLFGLWWTEEQVECAMGRAAGRALPSAPPSQRIALPLV